MEEHFRFIPLEVEIKRGICSSLDALRYFKLIVHAELKTDTRVSGLSLLSLFKLKQEQDMAEICCVWEFAKMRVCVSPYRCCSKWDFLLRASPIFSERHSSYKHKKCHVDRSQNTSFMLITLLFTWLSTRVYYEGHVKQNEEFQTVLPLNCHCVGWLAK